MILLDFVGHLHWQCKLSWWCWILFDIVVLMACIKRFLQVKSQVTLSGKRRRIRRPWSGLEERHHQTTMGWDHSSSVGLLPRSPMFFLKVKLGLRSCELPKKKGTSQNIPNLNCWSHFGGHVLIFLLFSTARIFHVQVVKIRLIDPNTYFGKGTARLCCCFFVGSFLTCVHHMKIWTPGQKSATALETCFPPWTRRQAKWTSWRFTWPRGLAAVTSISKVAAVLRKPKMDQCEIHSFTLPLGHWNRSLSCFQ